MTKCMLYKHGLYDICTKPTPASFCSSCCHLAKDTEVSVGIPPDYRAASPDCLLNIKLWIVWMFFWNDCYLLMTVYTYLHFVWLCLFVALGVTDIHFMYYVHVLCCIMTIKLILDLSWNLFHYLASPLLFHSFWLQNLFSCIISLGNRIHQGVWGQKKKSKHKLWQKRTPELTANI